MLNEKREQDGTLYVFDKVITKESLHGRMVTKLIVPNAVVIENDAIYRHQRQGRYLLRSKRPRPL